MRLTVTHMNSNETFEDTDRDYAVNMIHTICALAGPTSILDDAREDLRDQGVLEAVKVHDTSALFDWLVMVLSFQGIADAVAQQYMNEHGQATWAGVER